MTIYESRAVEYARACVEPDNRLVPRYVKKQAAKWLEIVEGKNPEAYVCEKTFNKICRLLKLMVHPDLQCSVYEGLEDYAWLLIAAVFCTKQKETGIDYYQTALLEIARKNFKTFNSGVIFIIGMLTCPKFSRFFSVAPDLKLSKELQGAIRKIIKASPLLNDGAIFKTLRSEIRCILTDSEYTPLAYSEDKMDGKLANIFLADEAGAMDDYPVEAMRSSQITLRNKLGVIISTQYPNDNNVMLTEIDMAKKILDGLYDNPRYFALLYEPDDELIKDWQTNDLCIYQSNPVAVAHEYIFDDIVQKRKAAVAYESKRQNYLCKHNNIQYKGLGTEGYVDVIKLKECVIKEDLEFWRGKSVYLGLDMSLTEDNTAVAMVCYAGGIIYAKVWGFLPGEKIELKSDKEKVDYKQMIENGCCFACGDEIIDYKFVEEFVLNIEEKYGVHIVQLGFDRYNAISSVQKFESAENPIECVEIKQHSSVLHPATKLLKERILSGGFRYDENRLLEINFQNARCAEDTNLNKYVNKKKSSGKVDMVVALINAVYLLNVNVILENELNWAVQT